MIKTLLNIIIRKFKKIFSDPIKTRIETLKTMYINRKNAIAQGEKELSAPFFIFGSQLEINRRASFWEGNESDEKYITDALLELEFMSTIKEEDRKLIKKGALLRQKLMEECVRLKK